MEENHFVADGDATLQQQTLSLNAAQNAFHAEVKVYAKGISINPADGVTMTVPQHPNFVTIEEIRDVDFVRELFLVIPDDLAAEKIRQAGQGRSLVFFNDVFVGGVLKKVAGFH